MSAKPAHKPPTVITLTLPDENDETRRGTLLVQRGDLARVHQFTYIHIADLTEVIADALIAFTAVETDPPVISELPPPLPSPAPAPVRKAAPPPPAAEPTVDIPLKKGRKAVRISHLKIVGGETDAAAYRQAVQLAAILIDGRLWDGETPIRIDDVYALAKQMKHLTARDMPLFSLTDFVQVGATSEPELVSDEIAFDDEDAEPITLTPPLQLVSSANGHHRTNGVTDPTTLL